MDGWKFKFKIQSNFIFQQQQCLCLSFQRPCKKNIEKVPLPPLLAILFRNQVLNSICPIYDVIKGTDNSPS